jgi:hypothetical protein
MQNKGAIIAYDGLLFNIQSFLKVVHASKVF